MNKSIIVFSIIIAYSLILLSPNAFALTPAIHMSDVTVSSGIATFSGRQINAEFVTNSSQLIGDNIDSITLQLRKTGSPTGTAQIGIFNTDLSVKKLFGTIDVSTISGSYTNKTFILPSEIYTIVSNDRIGIKFAGGNSTNNVAVMRDTNAADPFDGVNSYHTYYDTTWKAFTANDLYMILKGYTTNGGIIGPPGPPGADGTSCFVSSFILQCTNGSSFDLNTLQGPPGNPGQNGTSNFTDLTNVPAGLSNGDQDALRTYNQNIPAGGYGAPCNTLNSDTSTVSYLFRNKAAITELGFDPIIGNLPIFAEAGLDPFLGEITMFSGNFAPKGYAFAQGQLLSISQNTALFSILGTTYGGNGQTTFALPDMRCLESDNDVGPHYIIALEGLYPSRP